MGQPAWFWIELFHLCYEWHLDGGYLKICGKNVKSGYWTRLEWPYPGTVLEQPNFVIEILAAIKDEKMKIFAQGN